MQFRRWPRRIGWSAAKWSGARWSAAILLACVALTGVASAKANPSYTQVGRAIVIGPEDQVSDLTCFGCSIRVRGQVAGDVTAFGGSILVEGQGQIAGDVTAFGGNIHLGEGVKIAGDVTVFAGEIRRDPQATVSGDVTSMGGHGWLVPMLLAPFVILGLLIAFVIWLVQRARRPVVPAMPA